MCFMKINGIPHRLTKRINRTFFCAEILCNDSFTCIFNR